MRDFSLDHLTETTFEEYCYDLLSMLGLSNLDWRKGTGLSSSPSDRGRDIEGIKRLTDIDRETYSENWFIECKHYKQGVPPDAIQGALSWATSKRPHTLLIIASNFLSNAAKDYLVDYQRENKPYFRIKYWERPTLERLSLSKPALLIKYGLIEPSQVSISEFTRAFARFGRDLYKVLSAVINYGIPQYVEEMWNKLQDALMGVTFQYNELIEECIIENHRIELNMPLSKGPEELITMVQKLAEVSEYIAGCVWSNNILPQLKEKYPQRIRENFSSVRIVQMLRTVHLEITKIGCVGHDFDTHADLYSEEIRRVSLSAFSENKETYYPSMFIFSPRIQDHVEKLLNSPQVLVECGLFKAEAFDKADVSLQ